MLLTTRLFLLCTIFLSALACAPATKTQTTTVKPVRISAEQAAGKMFADFKPHVENHGSNQTLDVEAFLSSDGHLDAGVYRSEASRFEITEPYGVDEYMLFLKGGVRLISDDGTVVEAGPGDSVIIPREWTGVWESDGYTKIYVIYSADEKMTPLNNEKNE